MKFCDGPTTASFEDFYRREFPNLAVLAATTCGDAGAGEDLAQEAFVRAHEHWESVSLYDKPGAWVRRVAINLALNRRRRLANEARALLSLNPPERTSDAVFGGDPEIWSAVRKLAPKQRATIALHYLEDLPVSEIAEILGVSVSATTSTLHKARQKLALTLGPTAGEDNDNA